MKRWSALPVHQREVFAPLRLEGDPAAPLPDASGPHRRTSPVTGAVQRPRSNTGSLPPLPPGARASNESSQVGPLPTAPAAPAPAAVAAAPAVAEADDESIPELTDDVADESAPHRAPQVSSDRLIEPPSVIVDSSLEDPPMGEDAPVGRLAKLTRLDQARLSAAIDAALDDDEPQN